MESEKSLTYLPMASDDFGYPDESKEGLFTHEDWQGIQQKTFINWVNDKLRGNLKVAEWRINDLRHDLRDGLLLIYLLNNLKAPKKVGNGRYNKKPVHVTQKLENLKSCIDFMHNNDIHLVNIGEFSALHYNTVLPTCKIFITDKSQLNTNCSRMPLMYLL